MSESELFEEAVAFVLRAEGGYVDDPRDPGGETNMGISRRAYPAEDIQGMTRTRAVEIYRRYYWTACRCDELPGQVAILLFDGAVNQGPIAAIKLLQAEVGVVPDGVIGPKTLAAIRSRNHDDLAVRYASRRAVYYAGLTGFEHYGRGWMLRLFDCYRLALVVA
jgi:lysozyme family protein